MNDRKSVYGDWLSIPAVFWLAVSLANRSETSVQWLKWSLHSGVLECNISDTESLGTALAVRPQRKARIAVTVGGAMVIVADVLTASILPVTLVYIWNHTHTHRQTCAMLITESWHTSPLSRTFSVSQATFDTESKLRLHISQSWNELMYFKSWK